MCAIEAGLRNRRVLLLDKAKKAGSKIRISGGGKSNFTNLYVTPENFLSNNPHFCKSALSRYSQWDFMNLMSQAGLTWEERSHGQLFCEQGAQAIIDMLLGHCHEVGVKLLIQCDVLSITHADAFFLNTSKGKISCDSLVVATGGPSIPRMGSTDLGVQIARQFGLANIPFRPALVPFIFSSDFLKQWFQDLSGISLDVRVSCNEVSFREQMLITHRGLSGPVILQISSYWEKGDVIEIDVLPEIDAADWLLELRNTNTRSELKTVLSEKIPKRLAQRLCHNQLGSQPLNRYSNQDIMKIGSILNGWKIKPSGTEGMRTAEVSAGGVNTDGLSSKTMQSKQVPGLFFIGETVDVTGHLGGFNFQWAWSSGWCAGQYV
ncbi:MAG: NAD(P)/FAD-dependent oxidoreductase [Gammaproteobacteria bacterium]|nr:NAD(P)/FAD-dependent oxidoreductase [Gammaproteobacteria bacterium]